MCSKQWFVNWKLWSQNIDISPAMSLNDYLVVDIGFEQRNVNLLNQNLFLNTFKVIISLWNVL